MKLCKDEFEEFSNNHVASDQMDFELINFVEDPNCITCQRSVDKLNAIRGKSSKQFTVEEICGKDDAECSQFMLDFKDFFLQDHNRDSILACTELDVCLIPGRVQLLGGEKCKFGTAYSCLSSAHASACKIDNQFCKLNYWRAVEN